MVLSFIALLVAAQTPPSHAGHQRLAGERASDAPDTIVCKRLPKTGSLVGSSKVCKAKIDWERERDSFRQNLTSGAGSCSQQGVGGC